MTFRLTIVNPVAIPERQADPVAEFGLAPLPRELHGLRVGLFWNGKNHGDVALARTHENIAKLYEGVRFTTYLGEKGGLNRYISEGQLTRMLAECDVVVGTTADCGSCTSWLMRDMASLEQHGMPTAAFVSTGFVEDARVERGAVRVRGPPDRRGAAPVHQPGPRPHRGDGRRRRCRS